MQMRAHELQRLTVKELHNLAEKFKVENFSGLRKQDLIREILEKQAKNNEAILELLNELLAEMKELNDLKKIESLEKDLINNLDENSYSELIKLKSQLNRE